jgi:hypothetical protein
MQVSSKSLFASFRLALAIAIALAFSTANAADVISTWDGGVGDWTDAAHWSSDEYPNIVPDGSTYDAVINGGTVTQDLVDGITVENLTLSGGTLEGTNPLTATGLITWTGGYISNSGVTVGDLSMSGNTKYLTGGSQLILEGEGTLTGTSSVKLRDGVGILFTIQNSATMDVQGDAGFGMKLTTSPTAGTIDNHGVFKKSAGTGTTNIVSQWTVNNTGTIQVESGELAIDGEFSNNSPGSVDVQAGALSLAGGGISTGAFHVATGATLTFAGGDHNLTGATLANEGTVDCHAGLVTFDNGITSTGALNVSGGTLVLDGAISGSVNMTLSGGTLDGAATVLLRELDWSGGSIENTGGVEVYSFNASGTTKKLCGGSSLTLTGEGVLAGTGSIKAYDGANIQVTIQSTAELDIQSDAGFGYSHSGVVTDGQILNQGTFKKTGGTGVSQIDGVWTFSNTNVVQVESGTLRIAGAVTELSGTTLTGGMWIIGADSTLQIDTGDGITQIGAGSAVQLIGVGSAFTAGGDSLEDTLTTNDGLLNIFDGRELALANGFASNGDLVIDAASKLTVQSDMVLGGGASIIISLDDAASGLLDVAGNLALDGSLELQLADGFTPIQSEVFNIFDAASFTGSYERTDLTLPTLEGLLVWDWSNLNVTGEISVAHAVPGDANADGFVDETDAQALASHWGQNADWAGGDFNDDGVVNVKDAAILAANWTGGSNEATATPEPGTMVLLVVGFVGLLARRRR